jgi:hypothetical protein
MSFRKLFTRLVPAALAAVAAGLAATPSMAFDTAKVLNVIKFPRAGNTVLISHRGVIGPGCPENSNCSIAALKRLGTVEAIELDIKSSRSGELWLMHDQNIGRMTQPNYNMYRNTGSNGDMRWMYDSYLGSLRLKDRSGRFSGYYMQRLSSALRLTTGVVVILDLKTRADARRAAKIVKDMRAQNRVILKLGGGWYTKDPYWGIRADTGNGVPYAVTLYAGDLDRINNDAVFGGPGAMNKVTTWVNRAVSADITNFMFLEIGNKWQMGGDPTWPFVQAYRNSPIPISNFIPVPEYDQGDNKQGGYVRSDSSCCAKLSNYLTATRYFGNEVRDARPYILDGGDWTAWDSLLTDNVASAHNVLYGRGRRHIGLYR